MKIATLSRFAPLLAAAAMLAASPPASAEPATQPAAAQYQRNQSFQNRNWENYMQEMPVLDPQRPARAWADVLSLVCVDGQLMVRTALPSTPRGQRMRVKLDASGDWSLISIADGAAGNGSVIPSAFFLQRDRFDPDQTDILLVLQNKANSFRVCHQIITSAGGIVVTIDEQFANANAKVPGKCLLSITDQTPTGGLRAPPRTWISDNFSALEREHPIEADRYLRPLLHDLEQDAAFAPDPMLAFQVFSDQWTPGPAMTARVNALVANLGGGDFHSRTRAEKQLADLGQDAAVVLIHLDRSKLAPEQNTRIDKVLAPYCPVSAKQAERFRTDPAFLLDCLYSDAPAIRKIALSQLESVTKLKLNFDPAADPSQRNAAIPPLLQQLIDAKIIAPKP